MNENLTLKIQEKELGHLITNAEQIYENVKSEMAKYDSNIYLDIDLAKKDKAHLNAAAKLLNDERIKIEKEWNLPFLKFKETIKKTTDLIKATSNKINEVVAEQEKERKLKKFNEIKEYFDSLEIELFTLKLIFKDKWLNKSVSISSVKGEITTIVAEINTNVEVIKNMEGADDILPMYLQSLNLADSISKYNSIQEKKRLIEERAKQEEEKKREKIIEAEKEKALDNSDEEEIDPLAMFDKLKKSNFILELSANPEEIQKLRNFLNENNFNYEIYNN